MAQINVVISFLTTMENKSGAIYQITATLTNACKFCAEQTSVKCLSSNFVRIFVDVQNTFMIANKLLYNFDFPPKISTCALILNLQNSVVSFMRHLVKCNFSLFLLLARYVPNVAKRSI